MRKVGWLFVALLIVGWALSEVPVAQTDSSEPAIPQWRRTSDGWQRQSDLTAPVGVRPPALHPAVVGALELLVSLAALIGFPQVRRGHELERAGSGEERHRPRPRRVAGV